MKKWVQCDRFRRKLIRVLARLEQLQTEAYELEKEYGLDVEGYLNDATSAVSDCIEYPLNLERAKWQERAEVLERKKLESKH